MENINNYEVYTKGMAKSYRDKLFFLDKIDDAVKSILDFGCADGTLMAYIHEDLPDLKLVGCDSNEEMIIRTQKKGFNAYSDIEKCLQDIQCDETLLNLSSVIHEVYSYSSATEISDFWSNVFGKNFRYIAIRDFCVSSSVNRRSDVNDVVKILRNSDPKQLEEYISVWGRYMEQQKYRALLNEI